jgi:COP9 signalosome complex subunit 2
MADYEYDEYGGGDDDIEYDPNEHEEPQVNEDQGINFEDMFIMAESGHDPGKFLEIIELERDMSSTCDWTFKSYEKLCLLYIKDKNLDQFKNCFEKLFDFYGRVDDYCRQDTIRNCSYQLSDLGDPEFAIEALRFMLDLLKEKFIDREVMNTGLQFCKILMDMGRNDELGDLLDEMLRYMDRLDQNDEIYKSIRLELLVMKIQYCNATKNPKESKKLYIEAYKLNQDKIIDDKRLSAIINEEGGKLHIQQKEYEQALEKFKVAFHNYQEAGNIRAKNIFKYAILSSIISRNRKNIVSADEVRHYAGDERLNAMLQLQDAYEQMDINAINQIWNEKISKLEDDTFILENLNEILHNIRYNYICGKLRAYKRCSFTTLQKELSIDMNYLVSLLQEIILSESVRVSL